MYNNYEEYMQNVLGYRIPNTYIDTPEYYNRNPINTNLPEINKLYPEIYGIVYPIIQKICNQRNFTNLTEEVLAQAVEDIYNIIEVHETEEREEPLKNGDVRNPRSKETRRPPIRPNQTLKDLIRILLIRELMQGGGRPPFRPEPPHHGGFHGGMPERPGMGPVPPIMRPRKYENVLEIKFWQGIHPAKTLSCIL